MRRARTGAPTAAAQCRTSRASTSSGGASCALAGRCAAELRLGRRVGCVPLELGGTFGGT
jgi:hypothetical protein